MQTNKKTITIYNKKTINRNTLWLRSVVSGVNLHSATKSAVGDKELNTADEHIIRIPWNLVANNKRYVDDKTYKVLSDCELDNYFTVQKGDMIVKGAIDDEILSSGELLRKYSVMIVVCVTTNLISSEYSRHIKVVCK